MDPPSAPLSGLEASPSALSPGLEDSPSAPSHGPEITSFGGGFEFVLRSKELCRYISLRDWKSVVQLCQNNPKLLSKGTTGSNDTALHVAINDGKEETVRSLVDIIRDHRINQALLSSNNIGETALHCAAARGSVTMCDLILSAGKELHEDLLDAQNKWHENPIFVAVVHNRKRAFIYLCDAAWSKAEGPYEVYRYFVSIKGDGDTILHSAIRREHIDLAFLIIQKCPGLSLKLSTKGKMTPLEALARTPSVFRSTYNLSWWKQIIYFCIHVDPLKYDPNPTAETRPDLRRSSEFHCPENYFLCYHLLSYMTVFGRLVLRAMKRSNKSSNGEASASISQDPDHQLPAGEKEEKGKSLVSPIVNEDFPRNYATCYNFLAFVYLHFVGMMGFEYIFGNIRRVKEKYIWSLQLLDQLLEKCSAEEGSMKDAQNDIELGLPEEFAMFSAFARSQSAGGHQTEVESITNKALLAAAETGVIEVMHKILRRFPGTIPRDTVGPSNKNILMVAVENQHAEIFEVLRQHLTNMSLPNMWNDLVHAVDDHDNTILHIAAKYDESSSHAWQAYGTAMQMQCEVAWYEYVKSFVPSHYLFLKNATGETPVQIFSNGHKDLVEKGSAWLKDTSQSCSVVAALVAGVSYATSRSVPGGTDEKGKPTLEGQPAFELFAISGLIGLGFSVTALIMFLSILTSRKQPIDFKRNLPLKLLIGLSSLFVSIASMFISFCASHFFVLEDEFKKGIFPLFAVTCLPISFYAIAQFPLYLDLMKAIVKSVPQSQKYVQL